MSKNALVIVNPKAGMMKSKKNMFEIVDRLCQKGYSVTVQTTAMPGDGSRFIERFGQGQDLLVCCGGDGTLNEVINGMLHHQCKVPLGYVPAGTTNDFARTLGLPKKVEDCMDRILYGHPRDYDMGTFNGRNFTYIASLGAFTQVSYSTPQRLKNILGHSAYLLEGVKAVGSITPFEAEICTNGECFNGEFVFGAVANSTSIAGLFKLNQLDVRLDDGELELILVRNPKNATDLARTLNGITRGQYDPRYVIFEHIKNVDITTRLPRNWTLDGEAGGEQQKCHIEVIHNAIQLII